MRNKEKNGRGKNNQQAYEFTTFITTEWMALWEKKMRGSFFIRFRCMSYILNEVGRCMNKLWFLQKEAIVCPW